MKVGQRKRPSQRPEWGRAAWISVLTTGLLSLGAQPAAAKPAHTVNVRNEGALRSAWENPRVRSITLRRDIVLQQCDRGEPIRESPWPVDLDGGGHTIRQTCFENRLLRQDGTGFVRLHDVWLQRGGSDGPGAAVTTRGEIEIADSKVSQNLAEEPGGGVFSMRAATIIRSVFTGNLANDDGGAVYARRGGVRVIDSKLNGNLVDGSGGAIGSTGDVLVVRSNVDGNTTDGDGGAIYTDEDGDVTVIDSTVDGSTADGPGGAIFTLDGDVTIIGSTLNGNRADDRGGAISGEADVSVLDSTIARNAAVAHVGGGIWSRGNLYVAGSTISNNYAEGQGGGILGAGDVSVAYSTVADNVAPIASSIGAGSTLRSFASVIGPPSPTSTGEAQPTAENCRAGETISHGFNIATDSSCGLNTPTDQPNVADPRLLPLLDNGGMGETRMPISGSAARDAVPKPRCPFRPFGYDEEGEQHLAEFGIDPLAPTATDQRGAPRPFGTGCDAGSVEAGATPSPGLAPGPAEPLRFAPGPPAERAQLEATSLEPAAAAAPAAETRRTPVARGGSTIDKIRATLVENRRALRPLKEKAKHWESWRKCLTEVPIKELGHSKRHAGYSYNERDGSGGGLRSALTVTREGREDLRFLTLSREHGCESARTVVGGTADPARAGASGSAARPDSDAGLAQLQRQFDRQDKLVKRIEHSAADFDRWESCVQAVPVTEYGDPRKQFGYHYVNEDGVAGYRAAIAIDRSSWDDPDYEVLAFGAGTEKSPRCAGDPGEGVDRVTVGRGQGEGEAADNLLEDVRELNETVEDLAEPVFEFEMFDQCAFTLGMTSYGSRRGDNGYVYMDDGREQRQALAIDIDGFDPPEYDFLTFAGEEPPQIECNEDASGEGTDE